MLRKSGKDNSGTSNIRNIQTKLKETANTAALCMNPIDIWHMEETACGVDKTSL